MPAIDKLGTIEGLTFADCIQFFDERATTRHRCIAGMVDTRDEDFECDGSIVSEGEDNGAYVMGWRWVSFCGTPFDKEKED